MGNDVRESCRQSHEPLDTIIHRSYGHGHNLGKMESARGNCETIKMTGKETEECGTGGNCETIKMTGKETEECGTGGNCETIEMTGKETEECGTGGNM